MKKPVPISLGLGIIAAASFLAAPARADVGANDLQGTALEQGAMVDRVISVEPGTRWVNVDQGETVQFAVNGQGGPRQFVWRFDGLGDQVNLNDIDRSAALNVPIYVNQTINPLHALGGSGGD